jgi:hypothetical protein
MNREAIKEAKWFRDGFIEHRDETRKAFAATHELIARLHGEVMADIAGPHDGVFIPLEEDIDHFSWATPIDDPSDDERLRELIEVVKVVEELVSLRIAQSSPP